MDYRNLVLRNKLQEGRENPLGHPPDDLAAQRVCLEGPRFPANSHGDVAPDVPIGEPIERYPEGALDFGTRIEHRGSGNCEHERANDQGGKVWHARMQIVEGAETFSRLQIDTGFLERFPNGGGEEPGIRRVVATAGKCDVTGPGIAGALGTPDEENVELGAALLKHEGNGGETGSGLADLRSTVIRQRAANRGKRYHESTI